MTHFKFRWFILILTMTKTDGSLTTCHYRPMLVCAIFLLFLTDGAAFSAAGHRCRIVTPSLCVLLSARETFLDSLTCLDTINDGTKERTKFLNLMIHEKLDVDVTTLLGSASAADATLSATNPGRLSSIMPIAPGVWKVVYAPHMTTIAKLAGNTQLDVQYIMHRDQSIESHAKFSNVPFLKAVYLSVSGTYGTVSDTVCTVNWTDAWVKLIRDHDNTDAPYAQISEVPDSLTKAIITNTARLLFIKPFSIFPVSFLSHDLTVFDFALLGTRICARKVSQE